MVEGNKLKSDFKARIDVNWKFDDRFNIDFYYSNSSGS